MKNHVGHFREVILDAGLSPPEHIEPGKFHRFPGIGKKNGNKAGWCMLFPDGMGGIFGDHASNISETWQAKTDKRMTEHERAEFKRQIAEAKEQAEQTRWAGQAVAAEKAEKLWNQGIAAKENHPYLAKKGVMPHGIRQTDDMRLLVPLRDSSGKLHSLQFIDKEGDKRFLTDGKVSGCYFSLGGKPEVAGPVCIAEGFATAASIHQATGYPVAVAFNAGNLKAVALEFRAKRPEARLIMCADDDHATDGNPGITKATEAAKAIGGLLAVPEFSGDRPEKATDFNDLAKLRGPEMVLSCIKAAKPGPAQKSPAKVVAVGIGDFLAHEFPPRENLLSPWLPRQGLAMVYAPRGIGKTHFSLGLAVAVASGGNFLKWHAPNPVGVLFLDGEMPGSSLQERLARIIASSEKEPTAPLNIVTPDLQPAGRMIDLTSECDRQELCPLLENVSLIIVDNISTLCRRGKENEGEGWLPVQEWALLQRAAGRSVVFIHHAGKNGEQRGTSRREDVLDSVIALRHPGDYTPDKGACFEVHFEKARGIFGDDTKPFEAQLVTLKDGLRQEWSIKTLDQSTAEKVAALLTDGVKQKDIPEILGISKGAVSKARKRAQGLGLLTDVK